MKHPQLVVLVPVKAPTRGKSRLRVPEHLRPGVAAAFALDTIAAAATTPGVAEVVVVTDDDAFGDTCAGLGIAVEPDREGLNGSLLAAAHAVRRRHPDAVPVALCADLPCLRAEDLAAALAQVATGGTWFVADADGTGTTTYAAPYDLFDPQFGDGSSARHLAAGARPVTGELPTLRRDVDDEAGLAAAVALGPGPRTREAVSLLP
jgi:2-phospho-L-lactate/phosphoenolpyruvate guanylyltransferase